MLIGELSKKTKLSRHTIRYYEKLGLIAIPKTSRRGNNYKEYPDDTLRRIEAIQEIKSKGFTLREARGILALATAGTLDQERSRLYILKKVKLIEKQIEKLEEVNKVSCSGPSNAKQTNATLCASWKENLSFVSTSASHHHPVQACESCW